MIVFRNALVALLAASYYPMKALGQIVKCFDDDGFPEPCYDYTDGQLEETGIPGPQEWEDFDKERDWVCGGIKQSPVSVYTGDCDSRVQYTYVVSHDAVYILLLVMAGAVLSCILLHVVIRQTTHSPFFLAFFAAWYLHVQPDGL